MSSTGIKNILFPTDFSDLSQNALKTAIAISKRHKAVLHILHVVENRFLIVPPTNNPASIYVVPSMAEKGEKSLHTMVEGIQEKEGINTKPHLEFGNAADLIRDKALQLECNLIIMGSHGSSGFRELFIGNTVYAVIKNSTIPVLSIPGKNKITSFEKILFPVRAAKGIMNRYDFVASIIEKNKATLIVLGLSLKSEIFNLADRETEMVELGHSLGMNETSFKSIFHVCTNYAKKVLEVAKKEKVSLIVINATLDHKWNEFFIGPYAQQVINHAKVPVLSIRQPFSDEDAGE
jgi:nucleotide-binding universal stress UspA family protein